MLGTIQVTESDTALDGDIQNDFLFDRILHQGGYTKEEQIAFRAIIYGNILQSALALIRGMEMLGINFGTPAAQVRTLT